MNKHLRRLAPALAALVVGCNINESSSTEVASTSTGTLSPRLTMVNGSTIPQVDSLLVLLTVEGSSYSQDLKVGWNDAALQLKQIPLNKKWTLKIAGFMHADTVLANRDTAWYGEQTGTLTDSTPQTKNATALAVGLKSAAAVPSIAIGGIAPGSMQNVGDTFTFSGESSTQIVWTLDGSQPVCPDSPGTTQPLVLGTNLASKTVTLKARACTAGELPGRVKSYTFAVSNATTTSLTALLAIGSGTLNPSNKVEFDLWWNGAPTSGTPSKHISQARAGTSVALSDIPLDTPFRIKLTGISNEDTLWYGILDTTLSSSKAPSSISVNVKNVTSRPTIKYPLNPVEGDTLQISSTDEATTLLLLDSTQSVDCSKSQKTPLTKIFTTGKLDLQAIACHEGQWPSTNGRIALTVGRRLALEAPSIPPPGSTLPLDTTIEFSSTTGAGTISAGAIAKSGPFTKSDSTTLIRKTAIISSLNLKDLALAITPRSATTAQVLALIYLYDGNKVIDSVWRHWSVSLPVVDAPTLSLSKRSDSTLEFKWIHPTASSARIRSRIALGAWSTDSIMNPTDSLTIYGLATATTCSLEVIAIDAVTGRESVPAFLSGSTRNRPSIPTYSVTNSNTTTGEVTIALTSGNADTGTIWEVGLPTSSQMQFSNSEILDSVHQWSKDFGSGTYTFGLRAIRDGDTVYATAKSVSVTRTMAAAPQMPDLAVVRDLDALTWTWNTRENRNYRVYSKIGGNFTDTTETGVVKSTVTNGSYKVSSLSEGTTVGIKVCAISISASDSAGGLSAPKSSLAKTKAYPISSAISNLKGAQSGSKIIWTWNTSSDIISSKVGSTSVNPSGNQYSYSTDISATSRINSISVFACNADGLCNQTASTASIELPFQRATIDGSGKYWEIRVVGAKWFVRDRSSWTGTDELPSKVNMSINNATMESQDLNTARQGTLFNLDIKNSTATAKLQYVWANGDTSNTATFTSTGLNWPSFTGTSFAAAGSAADTLFGFTASRGAAYSTSILSHSKISGNWSPVNVPISGTGPINLDETILPSGLDSMRVLWTRVLPYNFIDSLWTTAEVNRTQLITVNYRDNTSGKVKTVRIDGKTWMAENLNYDIPYDTMDVCYNNDPANCATMGRLYTVAQAWNLIDSATSSLNHKCDTASGNLSLNCVAYPRMTGACPTGWHLPTALDWTTIGNTYGRDLLGGNWGASTESNAFGLNITWSSNAVALANGTWSFDPFSLGRQSFWSSTQNGAGFDDGFFVPHENRYNSHEGTVIYNDLTDLRPKQAIAYPIRCVKD